MIAARAVLLSGLLALASASDGLAQQVRTAVVPETVTVGDVFHVGIRLDLAGGETVEWPDTLPVGGDLEPAGRPDTSTTTAGDGARRVTARYPLSAWRPGTVELPTVAIRITGPGAAESRTISAMLPDVSVQSVLPADTTGIEPREARGVLGPDRVWWAWIALLLGIAGVGGGLAWWWVRNRGGGLPVPVAGESAREYALALLDRARADGYGGERRLKAFHATVAYAVRVYLGACDGSLGTDRTTFELEPHVREVFGDATAAPAIAVLRAADLVKFADHRPEADEAFATWRKARDWIEADPAGIDAPPEPAEDSDAESQGGGAASPEESEVRPPDPPREATA